MSEGERKSKELLLRKMHGYMLCIDLQEEEYKDYSGQPGITKHCREPSNPKKSMTPNQDGTVVGSANPRHEKAFQHRNNDIN